ncbi:hypothetical protein AAULR_15018 [Lacticaseibacillus rhamnosus MTCC 5462]|nr:hypothetical protein AAULR_15018 [Lacticaseibacillus rhamnosus MTCC 5462]
MATGPKKEGGTILAKKPPYALSSQEVLQEEKRN